MKEDIQSLIDISAANGRVCPQPMRWNEMWEMLPGRKQTAEGGWQPPLPLILGAWWASGIPAKRARFQEHLRWAEANGALARVRAFLEGLSKDDWFHDTD